MILTPEEIKAYIPTSTLTPNYLDKHEKRAILKHLPKYLGISLTKMLFDDAPSQPIADLIDELKGAIANLAYFEATPFIDVVPGNTGFGIVSNNTLSPASRQRVDAFKEAAIKAAEDSINNTLLFLEENTNDYPEWNNSSLIENGIISSINDWPDELPLNYNRIAFISLAPAIRHEQRMWLEKKLSIEFISSIAGTDELNVLPDIKRALAFRAYYATKVDEENIRPDLLHKWDSKSLEYLNSCTEYLNNHLENYPIYQEYGYTEKWQNNLEENGFLKMG